MWPRGHAGSALIMNLPLLAYFMQYDPIISTICTLIIMWLSIIPDFDFINRSILSKLEHRGFTHTIEFVIILSSISYILIIPLIYYFSISYPISMYLLISPIYGIVSHISIDIMDTTGINPFYTISNYSISKRYHLNIIKDGSSFYLNNFVLLIGFLLTIFIIIYYDYIGIY